jgi:hypothetical protein
MQQPLLKGCVELKKKRLKDVTAVQLSHPSAFNFFFHSETQILNSKFKN